MDCQRGAGDGWEGRRGAARPTRGERGTVLVEFALVFALFVLIIHALIVFGMILATKNSLTHAAAEGARAAVGAVDDPMTAGVDERVERARIKVNDSLSWLDQYDPADTTAAVNPCASGSSDCITVTITYPYSSRPVVPSPPGLGLVIPTNLTSTAVVELN